MVFCGNFILGLISLLCLRSAKNDYRKGRAENGMEKIEVATKLVIAWPLLLILFYVLLLLSYINSNWQMQLWIPQKNNTLVIFFCVAKYSEIEYVTHCIMDVEQVFGISRKSETTILEILESYRRVISCVCVVVNEQRITAYIYIFTLCDGSSTKLRF